MRKRKIHVREHFILIFFERFLELVPILLFRLVTQLDKVEQLCFTMFYHTQLHVLQEETGNVFHCQWWVYRFAAICADQEQPRAQHKKRQINKPQTDSR